MSFCTQWPGAVTLLLCLLCLCNNAKAQKETEKLPTFGDTIQILGAVRYHSSGPYFHIISNIYRWSEQIKTFKMD